MCSTVAKNPPANAADVRDTGSSPGMGRSPEEKNGNPSSVLAWKIPRTEEPGGLQFMGLQRVGQDCTSMQYTKNHNILGFRAVISKDQVIGVGIM